MQSTGHEKQEDVTLTDAVDESAEQLPLRLLVSVTVVKTVPRRVGGRKREGRSGKEGSSTSCPGSLCFSETRRLACWRGPRVT